MLHTYLPGVLSKWLVERKTNSIGEKKMDESEFQQRQGEIYNALASAVIGSLPEEWDVAQLRLGTAEVKDESISLSHELVNPKLDRGLVTAMPNDDVYEQTDRLQSLFREYGQLWSKATLEVSWDYDQEQWRFAMNYEYDSA